LATIENEHLESFCEVEAAQHIDDEFWRQQFCDDATDACRDDFERELLRVLLKFRRFSGRGLRLFETGILSRKNVV